MGAGLRIVISPFQQWGGESAASVETPGHANVRFGQIAQLVEHSIENAGVAGSSPALPIRRVFHRITRDASFDQVAWILRGFKAFSLAPVIDL